MLENKVAEASALVNELKNNIEMRGTRLRLKAVIHVSALAADLITNTLTLVAAILAFLFASLTLGFLIAELSGSMAIGFGGLTAFYVLIALLTGIFKDRFIEKKLIDFTIRKYFSKYHHHED